MSDEELKQISDAHNATVSVVDDAVRVQTRRTLAPNYNEMLQFKDFFDSIKKVCEGVK